jgi:hypothetical protein
MTTAHPSQETSILPAIIELVAGVLGFPGVGWIFAGKVFTGLKVLFIYWGAIMAFGLGFSMIIILTLGFASLLMFILAPFTIIIYFVVPVVSAGKLYNHLKQVDQWRQSSQPPQERIAPSLERYLQAKKQSQPQGLAGWQLAIIIGLTIVATLIFGGLAILLFVISRT